MPFTHFYSQCRSAILLLCTVIHLLFNWIHFHSVKFILFEADVKFSWHEAITFTIHILPDISTFPLVPLCLFHVSQLLELGKSSYIALSFSSQRNKVIVIHMSLCWLAGWLNPLFVGYFASLSFIPFCVYIYLMFNKHISFTQSKDMISTSYSCYFII